MPGPRWAEGAVGEGRAFDSFEHTGHACLVSATPPQGPSTRSLLPAARRDPIARPQFTSAAIQAQMAVARVDSRAGRERSTGHDVPTHNRAAARRAPPTCRPGHGCPPAPAPRPRRRAPLLRHQRLSHDAPPRSPEQRRVLPDLRVPAPPGLTRPTATRRPPAASRRDPSRTPVTPKVTPPGSGSVDRSWTTSRRGPNLVDSTPCGRWGGQEIIRPARRGRDERTAVPPQGGRAPRKGSRALRQEGWPFRKGGEAVRRSHRRRKVSDPLGRAGRVPKGAHSRPQGWRVPRKGGAATGWRSLRALSCPARCTLTPGLLSSNPGAVSGAAGAAHINPGTRPMCRDRPGPARP